MPILYPTGDFKLEALGLKVEERNLSRAQLIEKAILHHEGQLTENGSLSVSTGKFTGRSPKDKYIVQYENKTGFPIDWGNINHPIAPEKAEALLQKMIAFSQNKIIFAQDLSAGHSEHYFLNLHIYTEMAWQSLFARNLFLPQNLETSSSLGEFDLLALPSFLADPFLDGVSSETFIIIDFEKRFVLIGGTAYAGEIKKAIFTVMNKLYPEQGILPMHCSVNVGEDRQSALFFGLSGTGKTTLSSDVNRFLVGDDETGWSDEGVFNIEGGCYAKTSGLNEEMEPLIYQASTSFATLLENVVVNPHTRQPEFSNMALTENARAAYPLKFIPHAMLSNKAALHPRNIFFLSADASGVLPPISWLKPEQIIKYFLAGFTSKVSGTEIGLNHNPQVTFSACFAAPFLPLHPSIYANLLNKRIQQHQTNVWLINTGWTGGNFQEGSRIKLSFTRAMIRAAITGQISPDSLQDEGIFHLLVPTQVENIPNKILFPIQNWRSREEYLTKANRLLTQFSENEKQSIQGK
jgi:phosphoenolpyruvate carboxykinase (ATP)